VQVELPGNPETVLHPAEPRAEPVVVEWHEHCSALRKLGERLVEISFALAIDEYGDRRGEGEVVPAPYRSIRVISDPLNKET
jgi:hypothetical protein